MNEINDFLFGEYEEIESNIKKFKMFDPRFTYSTPEEIIYQSDVIIYKDRFTSSPIKILKIDEALPYLLKDYYLVFNNLMSDEKRDGKHIYTGPYQVLDIDGKEEEDKMNIILDGGLEHILEVLKNDKYCLFSGYSQSFKGIRAIYAIGMEHTLYGSEEIEEEHEKIKQQIKFYTLMEHLENLGLDNIRKYNDPIFRNVPQGSNRVGNKLHARRMKPELFLPIPDHIIYDTQLQRNLKSQSYINLTDLSGVICSYTSLSELSDKNLEKIDKHFREHPIRYQSGVDFFRYKNADMSTRRFLYEIFYKYYSGGSVAPRRALNAGFDTFNIYVDNLMKNTNSSNQAHWLGFFKGVGIKNISKKI